MTMINIFFHWFIDYLHVLYIYMKVTIKKNAEKLELKVLLIYCWFELVYFFVELPLWLKVLTSLQCSQAYWTKKCQRMH